jgi:hypothetical protein
MKASITPLVSDETAFTELRKSAETLQKESEMYNRFEVDSHMNRSVINRRQVKRVKREYVIVGDGGKELTKDLHKESTIFSGKSFCTSIFKPILTVNRYHDRC